MFTVRLDLTGKKPPQLLEAYDSPNDKSLEDIAHIIIRAVDLSQFAAITDNQEKCKEDLPATPKRVCETITTDELPDILTAKHISEHLHLSKTSVYDLFKLSPEAGGIPSFTFGKSHRTTKEKYLEWIDSRQKG